MTRDLATSSWPVPVAEEGFRRRDRMSFTVSWRQDHEQYEHVSTSSIAKRGRDSRDPRIY